jgi:hypothetical protein
MTYQHPYTEFEGSELWRALDQALADLEESSDIQLTTARDLVLGYLTKAVTRDGSVWVFNGESNRFPSSVFTNRDDAESWIRENNLSGTLTEYPLNIGVYDWAVRQGFVKGATADAHKIANFSSAHQQHSHFVDGKAD